MSQLEKDVDRAVTEALQLFGFDVSNFAQGYRPGGRRHGTTRQTKGIPDIYARHPILKISFWVEVKAPGKKVKEGSDQEKWHRMEHACGGLVLVMTSGAEMAEYLSSNIREWRRQRDAQNHNPRRNDEGMDSARRG